MVGVERGSAVTSFGCCGAGCDDRGSSTGDMLECVDVESR